MAFVSIMSGDKLYLITIRDEKKIKAYFNNPYKGGLKSEDMENFYVSKIYIPNHYPEQKI